MMLYRVTYIRDGSARGVTFAGADLVEALEFCSIWESVTGCPILTLKPVQARGMK
jgi:hypothetical protein